MFTGIVTDLGEILELEQKGDLRARIKTNYDTAGITFGASIACDGICLTAVDFGDDWFDVEISSETVSKTIIGSGLWKVGHTVNLERSLKVGDELGGHFVYGHVDTTTIVSEILELENSWEYHFEKKFNKNNRFIVEKGSISINGISLTVAKVENNTFMISVIDHTFHHTNLKFLKKSDQVNIEFDYLARFILNNE